MRLINKSPSINGVNHYSCIDGEDPRPLDLKKLEVLGLTHRQAEIGFWIAQGKPNKELAIILGASERTVAHHIEAILVRLQVSTRSEIMLRALEALGWLRWPTKSRKRRVSTGSTR